MGERRTPRGVLLVEDQRTEGFLRRVLSQRGWNPGSRMRVFVCPDGKGAAESWVRKRALDEIRVLRAARQTEYVILIAVRDGDRAGTARRKQEIDDDLREAGLPPRGASERIALLVPTWSIESWLLDLVGRTDTDEHRTPGDAEGATWKQLFDREARNLGEKALLQRAAEGWADGGGTLPSLADGRIEFARVQE